MFYQLNSLTSEDISVIISSEQNWVNTIILFVFAQPLKAMPFTLNHPKLSRGWRVFYVIVHSIYVEHNQLKHTHPFDDIGRDDSLKLSICFVYYHSDNL